MAQTELALKSPSVPLFQKEELSGYGSNPSLEKHALSQVEGKGRGDLQIV
jgi:hypothetical protein